MQGYNEDASQFHLREEKFSSLFEDDCLAEPESFGPRGWKAPDPFKKGERTFSPSKKEETGSATTMKKFTISLGILSILALSSASYATSVKDLVNANGCFACHSVDTKMVGPSFKMVADKYRGQKGADEMLAKKIIAGGNGHWNDVTGGVMMPPHPGMSMDQAEAVAKWVLATK